MIPGSDKEGYLDNVATISKKTKVLRSAIIYGPNASGKSNFMRAFQVLREMIINSGNYATDDVFEQYEPFSFDTNSEKKPAFFSIDFLLGPIRYQYQVSIQSDVVRTEILYYYPQNRRATLFSRQNNDFEFGEHLKGQKAVVAELTQSNQLFLSKAAQNNMSQLANVFTYFTQDFMPIPFLDSWMDSRYADRISVELRKQEQNGAYIENFKRLLNSFDTGIVDFQIKKTDFPFHDREFDIFADHLIYNDLGKNTGTKSIHMREESTGTQKLFVLGGLVLRAIMNGKVMMIDEFERSLHPHISQFLLQVFSDPKINSHNAQLIIATHDTNLLNRENQLRRDQIWIVEKDKYGASELFSLADIEGLRKEAPYEKWYLSGKLGGVPRIEKLNFMLNYQS